MKRFAAPLVLASFFMFVSGCGIGTGSDGLKISKDVEFGKKDYKKIVSSQNELGFDWLHDVEKDQNGNVFISPTSLFMALSMVSNGADGETKEEIAKVLHTSGLSNIELNKANSSIMSILHQHSKRIKLNVANSIWLNKHFHFQDQFSKDNQDYFNAKIQEIDINDRRSPSKINNWVKKATNNKINEIVDTPIDSNIDAILINAIYFNGNWKNAFDKKDTVERTFFLADGSTKDVEFMVQNKSLDYLENDSFQAVSLPYGNEEMSMKVFLPKENIDLEEFEKVLSNDNWQNWSSEFEDMQGTIMLPKFQLKYEVLLNETIERLGMKTAFTGDANFSKMIKEASPISITEVKQKTFIDVNEKGTEAAAATSIVMTKGAPSRSELFHMVVNRPFFIMIVDDRTGAILFMGEVSNPQ